MSKKRKKLRFPQPERGPKDAVEFFYSGVNGSSRWYVRVHNLPLLGPYDQLAEAWESWRGMDARERDLLQAVRRDRARRDREEATGDA